MKKQLLKLGAICIVLAMAGNLMAQAPIKTATIKQTEISPTIDGVEDLLWAGVEKNKIERAWPNQSISMVDNVAPTWQACWDATNTYILITVPDDHQYDHVEAGVGSWLADKPEVYFDVNAKKVEDPAVGPSTSVSGHFQFAPDFTCIVTPPTHHDAAFKIDGNDKGYIFEYAIPHTSLYDLNSAVINPKNGLVIGFDVTILDLDAQGKGKNVEVGRANWSNDMLTAGESWVDMNMSGDVTYSTEFIVGPKIEAEFSASKTSVGLGETVKFTDLSTNLPSEWTWYFGDGATSSLQNPTHEYKSSGVYSVSLKAGKSGSSNTMNKPSYITVSQQAVKPIANFSADTTTFILGETVSFTDMSVNSPTEWSWNFGDGGISTAQNPLYKYDSVGIFSVALEVKNTIGKDALVKNNFIKVLDPVPVALFVINDPSVEIGKPVIFNDLSLNNPTSWFWDFGDGTGSTIQNPSHIYNTTGLYTIVLVVANGTGSDTVIQENYLNITLVDISSESINKRVQLFPNPSKGMFNLKVEENLKSDLFVQIIDASGKTVFTKYKIAPAGEKIDLSTYPKGIYFMQLSGINYLQTEKLIVN